MFHVFEVAIRWILRDKYMTIFYSNANFYTLNLIFLSKTQKWQNISCELSSIFIDEKFIDNLW